MKDNKKPLFLFLSTLCAAWLAWVCTLSGNLTNQREEIILSFIYKLSLRSGTNLCLPALRRQCLSQNLQEVNSFDLSTNLSGVGELVSAGDTTGTPEGYLHLLL